MPNMMFLSFFFFVIMFQSFAGGFFLSFKAGSLSFDGSSFPLSRLAKQS